MRAPVLLAQGGVGVAVDGADSHDALQRGRHLAPVRRQLAAVAAATQSGKDLVASGCR